MESRIEAIEGIHDLVRLVPSRSGGQGGIERAVALRFEDHLLRRFGQAEIVRLAAGALLLQPAQPIADDVWILVDGQAVFEWRDQREASPTHGGVARLDCDEPVALLVPFGVALSLSTSTGTTLLRLTTHSDDTGSNLPTPA
jgi:dTDP-4-dehydrorhamnose 3,5-epimerase-like enzyme